MELANYLHLLTAHFSFTIIIIILVITFKVCTYSYVSKTDHVLGYILLQLFCICNLCYIIVGFILVDGGRKWFNGVMNCKAYTAAVGTRWRTWLRHCATSRKVAGSVPYGVIGIFHWHNPSGCTVALGSTQPLIEMSTRNIYWGVKAAGAKGWQPYHLHVPIVLKSGSLNLLEPSGSVEACNGIAFTFSFSYM